MGDNDNKHSKKSNEGEAYYYKLNVGEIPDELYRDSVPVEEWLKRTTTATKDEGFPLNSLNKLSPIPWDVELERIVGISLYMMGNVFPFLVTILLVLSFFVVAAKYALYFVLFYSTSLYVLEQYYFRPKWNTDPENKPLMKEHNYRYNQYFFTERNITKYLSMNFVWPKSLMRPKMQETTTTPLIYCVVPHGVAPYGITAYPLWSKVWNDRLCRWTCAPILLKIPVVSYYLQQMGYVPAKSKYIIDVLTKKEENVGVVLDGIAGMFQSTNSGEEEVAYLQKRKGIVKIALKAGVPIVPVYGFGHTSMYTVLVDPLGILKWISLSLQASLTPFFGRWGWFLGPPRRVPITVCLGEPVNCPKTPDPTQEQINDYHDKLLQSFQEVFDTHKHAYGWGHKKLKIV